MDQKVCLDTDVCVEILKNTEKGKLKQKEIESYETFITTVSVFELFLREKNFYPVERLLSEANVLDFTEIGARKSSEILKHLKNNGKMIDMRDLFIASTCIVNNCKLATFNKKHFENIGELELI